MGGFGNARTRPNEPPMPNPLGFFLTWTTYGTWLPGDERGWVRRGGGLQAANPARKKAAQERMTESPCTLDIEQRACGEDGGGALRPARMATSRGQLPNGARPRRGLRGSQAENRREPTESLVHAKTEDARLLAATDGVRIGGPSEAASATLATKKALKPPFVTCAIANNDGHDTSPKRQRG